MTSQTSGGLERGARRGRARRVAAHPRRFLPLVVLLLVGSGCSALIYEIVWLQMLQLVVGSTAVSLGVLLGTFMGGLCLGSLLVPRWVSRRHHPLMVYAGLEVGIGAIGTVVYFCVPPLAGQYATAAGVGIPGVLLRGLVAGLCLLPPTLLMGATLPAISRFIDTTNEGVSWMGFFYGGNLVGGVVGCLAAGFYLLPNFNLGVATFSAVALNAVVALLAIGLATSTSYAEAETSRNEGNVQQPKRRQRAGRPDHRRGALWPVYVTIGLSGLTALAAEVVWTRLLSLLLGGTVYTFSIILAVFLIGLGIGGALGSLTARTVQRPRVALGFCQMLLAGAIAWAAYAINSLLPYWLVISGPADTAWFTFWLDIKRCATVSIPAALLWGMSVPLALAAVARKGQDAGELVGKVYSANTVGAILGALGFSMVLVPVLGTRKSEQAMMALATMSGLLMLLPELMNDGRSAASQTQPMPFRSRVTLAGMLAAMVLAAMGLSWLTPPLMPELVAYGRNVAEREHEFQKDPRLRPDYLYVGEGMNATVAVTKMIDGSRWFHVGGRVEATTAPLDMRLQRMLGHIPALLHPEAKTVLVVGFGSGVTAGSFLTYPGIEKVVICEIEPLIPQMVAPYFARENYNVVNDRRVQIVYDDARHYILTTNEKFDIITSDPVHPLVKGAAMLYTKEYFQHVSKHLNPGGIVTQWVPLYESSERAVKSEMATFFDVFPNGTIWSNDKYYRDGSRVGYDTVLMGQLAGRGTTGTMVLDVAKLAGRMGNPEYALAQQSLAEVQLPDALSLLSLYAGRASGLTSYLIDAPINTDKNLTLQYLAASGMDLDAGKVIHTHLRRYMVYPNDLFVNAGSMEQLLRRVLEPASATTGPTEGPTHPSSHARAPGAV